MDTILAYFGNFPYLGIFALLILGGIGLPFPEDATLILTGFLISAEVVKPVPALVIVFAGIMVSDFVLYMFGRKYGRMVVRHKRLHRILPPEKLASLEEKFKRHGVLLILLGRHVAGLRAQILIVSGVMKMSRLKFLLADGFTALITIAVFAGIGYKGGESLQVLKKGMARVEHIGVVAAVAAVVAFVFYLYFKPRRVK